MTIQALADAFVSKELERYSAWFAEDMRLYVPVYEEPLIGKEAACQILPVVFSLFENFHYPDVFSGQQTHALVFRAEVSGISLEGVDYLHTNKNGLVTEFSVTMRPLKAISALSKAIGVKMKNG